MMYMYLCLIYNFSSVFYLDYIKIVLETFHKFCNLQKKSVSLRVRCWNHYWNKTTILKKMGMYFATTVEIVSECSRLSECLSHFTNILIYCPKFACLKLNTSGPAFCLYSTWTTWVTSKLNSILHVVSKLASSFQNSGHIK